MVRMEAAEKRRLARLRPALTARKNADVAAFAEARAAVERIEREMEGIFEALAAVAPQLDMADLAERAAYERWRTAQKQRLADLETAKQEADAQLEQRRLELTRSNGEVEALKRLLGE